MDRSIDRLERELIEITSANTSSKIESARPVAGAGNRKNRKTIHHLNSLGQSKTSFQTKIETSTSQDVTPDELKQFLDQTGDSVISSNNYTHHGRHLKPASGASNTSSTPCVDLPPRSKPKDHHMGAGKKRYNILGPNQQQTYQVERTMSNQAMNAFRQMLDTPELTEKLMKTPHTDGKRKQLVKNCTVDIQKPSLTSHQVLSTKVDRQIGNRNSWQAQKTTTDPKPSVQRPPKTQYKQTRSLITKDMFVPSASQNVQEDLIVPKRVQTNIKRKRDAQRLMIQSLEKKNEILKLRNHNQSASSSRPLTKTEPREFNLHKPRMRSNCSACKDKHEDGHNHSVTSSQMSYFDKMNNKKCAVHQVRGCDLCSSRCSSLSSNQSYRNYLNFNSKWSLNPRNAQKTAQKKNKARTFNLDHFSSGCKQPKSSARHRIKPPKESVTKNPSQTSMQIKIENLNRGQTQDGERTNRIAARRKTMDLVDQELSEMESQLKSMVSTSMHNITPVIQGPPGNQMAVTCDPNGFFDPRRTQQTLNQSILGKYPNSTNRTHNTYYQSDTSQMQNQIEHVRNLREQWEGDPHHDNFWQGKDRTASSMERHRNAAETLPAESVLKQQLEIYEKLKVKASQDHFTDIQDVKALEAGSDYEDRDYDDFVKLNVLGEITQTLPVDNEIDDDSLRFESEHAKAQHIDFRPANYLTVTQEDEEIYDHDAALRFQQQQAQDAVHSETIEDIAKDQPQVQKDDQPLDNQKSGDSQEDEDSYDEENDDENDQVEPIAAMKPSSRGCLQSQKSKRLSTPLKEKIEEASEDSASEEDTSKMNVTNYDEWLAWRSEQESRLQQISRATPQSLADQLSKDRTSSQNTLPQDLEQATVNLFNLVDKRLMTADSNLRSGQSLKKHLPQLDHIEPKTSFASIDKPSSNYESRNPSLTLLDPLPLPKQKLQKMHQALIDASESARGLIQCSEKEVDDFQCVKDPTKHGNDSSLTAAVLLGSVVNNKLVASNASLKAESKNSTPHSSLRPLSSKLRDSLPQKTPKLPVVAQKLISQKPPLVLNDNLSQKRNFQGEEELALQTRTISENAPPLAATTQGLLTSDMANMRSEERLDLQLNEIKYDQSNDCMSASFYKQLSLAHPPIVQKQFGLVLSQADAKSKFQDPKIAENPSQPYQRPIKSIQRQVEANPKAPPRADLHSTKDSTQAKIPLPPAEKQISNELATIGSVEKDLRPSELSRDSSNHSSILCTDKQILKLCTTEFEGAGTNTPQAGEQQKLNCEVAGRVCDELDQDPASHEAVERIVIAEGLSQRSLSNDSCAESKCFESDFADTKTELALNEQPFMEDMDLLQDFEPHIEEVKAHWQLAVPAEGLPQQPLLSLKKDTKAVQAPSEAEVLTGSPPSVPEIGDASQVPLALMIADWVASFPEVLSETTQGSAGAKLQMQRAPSQETLKTDYGDLSLHLESEFNLSQGCEADFDNEEAKEGRETMLEGFVESYQVGEQVSGKRDVAIQTSKIYFKELSRTKEFRALALQKQYSTDWALSGIFDEICCEREVVNTFIEPEKDETGNQVEEKQIFQATQVQILSQIECEYNAELLKRKKIGKNTVEDCERLLELYILGLNTLQAMMYLLRLQKEWETVTRHQYSLDNSFDGSMCSAKSLRIDVQPDQLIKLLTRCKKMYEAQTLIWQLLHMVVKRDQLVSTQRGHKPTSDSMARIRRLTARITSQINTLQEEHRIFRRPFILRGKEYLKQMHREMELFEEAFEADYYVDETGTVGESFQ